MVWQQFDKDCLLNLRSFKLARADGFVRCTSGHDHNTQAASHVLVEHVVFAHDKRASISQVIAAIGIRRCRVRCAKHPWLARTSGCHAAPSWAQSQHCPQPHSIVRQGETGSVDARHRHALVYPKAPWCTQVSDDLRVLQSKCFHQLSLLLCAAWHRIWTCGRGVGCEHGERRDCEQTSTTVTEQ